MCSRPDSSYLLAVCEREEGGEGEEASEGVRVGLCAVDVSTGQVMGPRMDPCMGSCMDPRMGSCMGIAWGLAWGLDPLCMVQVIVGEFLDDNLRQDPYTLQYPLLLFLFPSPIHS